MEVGVRRGAHFQFAEPNEDARQHRLIAANRRDRSAETQGVRCIDSLAYESCDAGAGPQNLSRPARSKSFDEGCGPDFSLFTVAHKKSNKEDGRSND